MTGQEISRQGDPAGARKVFSELAAAAPNAPNLPDIQLAIGRTFQQEENWPEIIRLCDTWLGTFTNHPAQAQAEYYRACATSKAGDETNALRFYTNFVARFPTNDLTPTAQWWVGDYYFSRGSREDLFLAEQTFQILYLGSNHLDSDLVYQAGMMAGIAARKRQGWDKAKEYFSDLAANSNCPTDLRLQARFAYADLLAEGQTLTTQLQDLERAIQIFGSICDLTNSLAASAWGRKADCLLQYAKLAKKSLEPALIAYQQVTNFPDADPAIRASAKIGAARVIEIEAEAMTGQEQAEQLNLALNLYLDVLYDERQLRDGGKPNLLFWTQKAGLEAERLAESMQDWRHAIKIYERLKTLLPVLSPSLDKKILNAREKFVSEEKPPP
jgi:tetratricopeptide (TPR) repeat protein